jgi:hypothetical protein
MGTEDIDKLLACCEEYGHPCPNELRLIYIPVWGVLTLNTNISLFLRWRT